MLRKVFERRRAFKLRMNPLKCAFVVSSRKFLGFLVHSKGIDVDPAKATAIATMRPPAMVKELKSFLGKVSYIRRFIPGLASIMLAFTKLLKKGQSFEWGGSATDGLQKAAADNDEPPHGAGSYSQKTAVTLSDHQLIRHWRANRSGRQRWY